MIKDNCYPHSKSPIKKCKRHDGNRKIMTCLYVQKKKKKKPEANGDRWEQDGKKRRIGMITSISSSDTSE